MREISRPYQNELLKALRDPAEAAEYLSAALEEGDNELFLLALQNVAEARGTENFPNGGHPDLDSMCRMVSEGENPQLSSLSSILKRLGLKLAIEVTDSVSA